MSERGGQKRKGQREQEGKVGLGSKLERGATEEGVSDKGTKGLVLRGLV